MENQEIATIYKQAGSRIAVSIGALKTNKFKKTLDIFRSIDKRFWDSEKKQWFLPLAALDQVNEKLQALDLKVEIKEYQPAINIVESDIECTIESDYNPETYDIFRGINKASWNHTDKLWHMPIEALHDLITLLEEKNMQYTLTKQAVGKEIPPAPRPKKQRH